MQFWLTRNRPAADHMVNVVRNQEPDLWDTRLESGMVQMLHEGVDCGQRRRCVFLKIFDVSEDQYFC